MVADGLREYKFDVELDNFIYKVLKSAGFDPDELSEKGQKDLKKSMAIIAKHLAAQETDKEREHYLEMVVTKQQFMLRRYMDLVDKLTGDQ